MTIHTPPVLSIVMPCFNHSELISQMIDSILANDYNDWELLAVDDGSEANHLAVLNNYEARDARIHVIKRDRLPKGAPTCRNIGFNMAQGEYIIFFDSDDYITPTCLSTRVREIAQRPDLDFMVFPSATYENGSFCPTPTSPACGYKVYKNAKAMFARRRLPFFVVNNIWRTSSLRNHGITWDERLLSLQDADFNIQALLRNLKFDYAYVLPDYGYRIAGNVQSVSKKMRSEEHRKSSLYALDRFYREYQSAEGHRYDFSLFFGALWIYNHTLSDGFDKDFSHQTAKVVKKYSTFYGYLFGLMVSLSYFLSLFLPSKISRQIPMLPYLLWKDIRLRIAVKQMLQIYHSLLPTHDSK